MFRERSTDPDVERQFVVARFDSKVVKSPEPDGCWEWTAAKDKRSGYGRFNVAGSIMLAHRFAYERTYGSLPADVKVRHKCDNTVCVRPDHLKPGTQHQNMRDMVDRGRSAKGERHGASKLTEARVVEARKRHADGESIASIARDMKMARESMRHAVAGINWRHVPMV